MKGKKIIELFFVAVLFSALVFGVEYLMGTLTCGWHFVDDHEYSEFKYLMEYKNYSLIDVIKEFLIMDDATRFRPLYFPSRIILYVLTGGSLFAMEIAKAVETIIAMVLIYLCGRKITDSVRVGIMFSLVCFVGYQSAVWWKLGPEQIQGSICFGIAFLSLLYYLDDDSKVILAIVSCFFSVCMGLYHESFYLVMPFLSFYVLYDEYKKEPYKISQLRKRMGKRLIYVVLNLAICCALILGILYRLGFNSYSDVGFSEDSSIISHFAMTIASLHYNIKWYWMLGLVLVGILLTYYDSLKKNWADIGLAFVFMFPQLVLYSKEGLSERYIIPIVIGYALYFIVFIYKEKILRGYRRFAYILICYLMLFANAHAMVTEADYYRFRGQGVTNALEVVDEMSQKGYKVLSCFGNANPEADWTVEMYLKSQGKPDVYYWRQDEQKVYDNRYFQEDGVEETVSASDMDVILAYNRNDRHFEIDPNIDFSDYTCIRSAGIDIYFGGAAKDEATDEMIQILQVKPTLSGIGE